MSSFISNLASHIPPSAQVVLRTAAPIVVDFLVTRICHMPHAAMIPALGTLTLATKNVSTFEKMAGSLLYATYKALSLRLLSDKKNLSGEDRQSLLHSSVLADVLLPPPKHPCFEELQESFKTNILPSVTWHARSSDDEISSSEIITKWTQIHLIQRKSVNVFRLAAADLTSLYEELKKATEQFAEQPQEQYKQMAALLSDKQKTYYARFCDPSKPTLLFFYRFVRGHVYYTKVEGKHYTHSVPLTFENESQFFESSNLPTRWREIYNEHVKKWSGVIQCLPTEIAEWAVPDENMDIAKDDSPERVFKIKHALLLQIPTQELR
jgi:hypothetical protein